MGLNDSEGSIPRLACRGLGMQRSVKSQALTLHWGPIVLQSIKTPTKEGHSVVCLFHLAGFCCCACFYLFIYSMCSTAADFCFLSSHQFTELWTVCCGLDVFSLSPHPTRLLNPSWLWSHHIRPCLTAPKQEAAAPDNLSYYLGQWPAMPLTLCHIAYSKLKAFGTRELPACILSVWVYNWCVWRFVVLTPQASGNTLSITWHSDSSMGGGQQREQLGNGERVLSVWPSKWSLACEEQEILIDGKTGWTTETEMTEGAVAVEPTSVLKSPPFCHERAQWR